MSKIASSEKIDVLREGAEAFHRGSYWDAHEIWERVWRDYQVNSGPESALRTLQSLIQWAGAAHLFEQCRDDPALRLVSAGFAKWDEWSSSAQGVFEGLSVSVSGIEQLRARPDLASLRALRIQFQG